MYKITYLSIAILIWGLFLKVQATTFVPISLGQQVKGTAGGVVAKLKDQNSFKEGNFVYTNYIFSIKENYLKDKSIVLENEISIRLPGGALDGVRTIVDSSPVFEKEKEIFLLVKIVKGKVYLSNFTAGVFDIVKKDGEDFFINQAFKNVPGIGKIAKSKMIQLMSNENSVVYLNGSKKNSSGNEPQVTNLQNKKERKPAQVEQVKFDTYQLTIFITAFFGIVMALLLLSRKKNE